MTAWKRLASSIKTAGVLTAADAAALKTAILADGRISREEAECLLDLHRAVPSHDAAFTQFLFDFIKRVVLVDGTITANETAWLKSVVFHDRQIDPVEKALMKELKDAVLVSCPAFDDLWAQYESV